ncbi:MAG TPA: hypothetical protein VFD67_03260, partial [Gemmatimonadaceae bacterium]|nr:hypothetical protein [Gemmatimonadaceae bacterium]
HMRQSRLSSFLLPALIAGNVYPVMAQQTDVAISPSLSLPAKGGTGTMGGLALTLAGSPGFALRASGLVALKNAPPSTVGATPSLRPWAADLDAVFALAGRPLGSRNRSVSSYGFMGMGESAMDTANVGAIKTSWSYGVGSLVPIGALLDLFAEWRWRMPKLVLPTARPKPTPSKEVRFGISVHLARGN